MVTSPREHPSAAGPSPVRPGTVAPKPFASASLPTEEAEPAPRRTVEKERRRWAFRSAVALGLTAILLSFFVTWRRDEMTVESALRSLKETVKLIQTQLDKTGFLPGELPDQISERLELRLSPADRFYAGQTSDPVIVAAGPMLILHLKEDGRAVIVYQQGKVHTEWMNRRLYDETIVRQEQAMTEFEQERRAKPPNLP